MSKSEVRKTKSRLIIDRSVISHDSETGDPNQRECGTNGNGSLTESGPHLERNRTVLRMVRVLVRPLERVLTLTNHRRLMTTTSEKPAYGQHVHRINIPS